MSKMTAVTQVLVLSTLPTVVSGAPCAAGVEMVNGVGTCPAVKTDCAGDCVYASATITGADPSSGVAYTDVPFGTYVCEATGGVHTTETWQSGANTLIANGDSSMTDAGITSMTVSLAAVCANGANADCTGCAGANNSDAGRGSMIAGMVAAAAFFLA